MATREFTHIDYAVLGLVKQDAMSGYQIRMTFEKTALGNFSTSPGTIYPALKRLESLGAIEKRRHSNGKTRDLFTITRTGLGALVTWLSQPVSQRDVAKNHELQLLRFAFMGGTISRESMIRFLKSFESATAAYIRELEAFQKAESGNLTLSGSLAFAHGIASYKTTLRWCRKAQIQVEKLPAA